MYDLILLLPKIARAVFIGLIVILILAAGLLLWSLFKPEVPSFTTNTNPAPEDIDYQEASASDLSGYLYFDSIGLPAEGEIDNPVDEEDRLSANLYLYDLANEATVPILEYGESYDGNPVTETSIAFMTTLSAGEAATRSAHVLLDTMTGDYIELTDGEETSAHELVASPENPDSIAYVFRNDSAEDQYIVSSYGILTYDHTLGTDVEIHDAVSPAWNAEGTALYFVKADGIYRYDLNTGNTTLVNNQYTDHSIFTHLAVAPDESFLLLTMPALNTISVMSLGLSNEGQYVATESEVIQDAEVVYKTPVISPDSQFYAVAAVRGIDNQKEHTIEIRSSLNNEIVVSFMPKATDSRYLNLSAWSAGMVAAYEDTI